MCFQQVFDTLRDEYKNKLDWEYALSLYKKCKTYINIMVDYNVLNQ